MKRMQGAVFDLDGVICDTAKYHYLAWKRLADYLGFKFTEKDNERLKGVSRERSLEILLQIGKIDADAEQKEEWKEKKNRWYIECISKMTEDEILPGVRKLLYEMHSLGVRVSLGSSSKNARMILERLGIARMFDYIVDGTMVQRAKPDPEVFHKAAEGMRVAPENCIVFEDAQAGVEAAHNAGMKCVGVGKADILIGADCYINGFTEIKAEDLIIWK